MSKWLEFALQLIATLIGTGIGFGLTMLWDRKKKRHDENEFIMMPGAAEDSRMDTTRNS